MFLHIGLAVQAGTPMAVPGEALTCFILFRGVGSPLPCFFWPKNIPAGGIILLCPQRPQQITADDVALNF